jgi:hypothetical protein
MCGCEEELAETIAMITVTAKIKCYNYEIVIALAGG